MLTSSLYACVPLHAMMFQISYSCMLFIVHALHPEQGSIDYHWTCCPHFEQRIHIECIALTCKCTVTHKIQYCIGWSINKLSKIKSKRSRHFHAHDLYNALCLWVFCEKPSNKTKIKKKHFVRNLVIKKNLLHMFCPFMRKLSTLLRFCFWEKVSFLHKFSDLSAKLQI